MNVEASAAPEKWEKLLTHIQKCADTYASALVELTDSKADRYDFANEVLMSRMQERLLATLQRATQSDTNSHLTFGNKFFMTMNEQQQKTFFHGIFNLRVGTIVIGEATDNKTLPQLQTSVLRLIISNFALTRQSDVQALSNIILSKCGNLAELQLKSIECPVDDCNKEDSDESDGFLDPLFFATSGLHTFGVSTKMRPVYSALVSPSALRALFVERNRFQRLIMLRGLGLTDSHVLAIADGLSSTYGTQSLTLDSNPGITSEGYDALFRLVKGENVIYGPHWSTKFCVDDKALEGKLNLVSEMNAEYGVLMYLPNGTYPSEERRWQWLEKVADLPMPDEKSFGFKFCGTNEEWDAKHLNFIWYTLCQNPDMMKT